MSSSVYECEKCGNGLIPGDLKCKICGFFSGRVCTSCHNHVPSGQTLCDVCGYDLGPEFPGTGAGERTIPLIHLNTVVSEPELEERDPTLLRQMAAIPDDPSLSLPLQRSEPIVPEGGHGRAITRPLPPVESPYEAKTVAMKSPLMEAVAAPSPLPSTPPPSPPPLPPLDSAYSGVDRKPERIDHTDYPLILETCDELIKSRCDIYGVFGRPESGKTLFIYALGKMLKGWFNQTAEPIKLGNYALDSNWENLIHFQEDQFETGQNMPTARGLHFYKASAIGRREKHRHFAIIDIRGEQFEQIDDWGKEITGFFLTYLTHCKGLFLFLDLDPDTVCKSAAEVLDRQARLKGDVLTESEKSSYLQAWRFKRDQMNHIVKFLSVAATVARVSSVKDYEAQRSALSQAHRQESFGSQTVKVPVVLCIGKADQIKDYRFDGYPVIVPGSETYLGNPWNTLEAFFPKEMESLKKLVPRLKVEWVSSTGENFQPKRGISRPLGLASAFNHVVQQPPPTWTLPVRHYQQLARFFGLKI